MFLPGYARYAVSMIMLAILAERLSGLCWLAGYAAYAGRLCWKCWIYWLAIMAGYVCWLCWVCWLAIMAMLEVYFVYDDSYVGYAS